MKTHFMESVLQDNVRDRLEERFPCRKLFSAGTFKISQGSYDEYELQPDTNLLPLWLKYPFEEHP